MPITLATVTILAITGLVFGANKILHLRVCPICAGVSGTWLLMLVLRILGYPISTLALAMLMGGSVVGISYQLEKRLPEWRSSLLFKTLFIPVGFIAAYGIVEENWVLVGATIAVLCVITSLFLSRTSPPDADTIAELKKKMDECC